MNASINPKRPSRPRKLKASILAHTLTLPRTPDLAEPRHRTLNSERRPKLDRHGAGGLRDAGETASTGLGPLVRVGSTAGAACGAVLGPGDGVGCLDVGGESEEEERGEGMKARHGR